MRDRSIERQLFYKNIQKKLFIVLIKRVLHAQKNACNQSN